MAAGTRQRQGNSRQRFVAGKADARCKRGPAPDEYMDMRFRPAHQSLFTNVPGRVPTPMRTIIPRPAPHGVTRYCTPRRLTKDIRALFTPHLFVRLGI